MASKKKDQICAFLNGIETGDPEAVAVVNESQYIQHNPHMADGLPGRCEVLAADDKGRRYDKVHRLLAEGSLGLCVSEGDLDGTQVSFYDLFRVANGKVVEHWDTVDPVPPRSEWVNNNGKFQGRDLGG